MKNILCLFTIFLLVSCANEKSEQITFELLPSPQDISVNSEMSTLNAGALQGAFSP